MSTNRNIPLDILRGIVIFGMMFVDAMPFFGYYEGIFAHAAWQGATVADLVFPGFIFSMGAAAYFSRKKFQKYSNKVFFKKIFRRSLILFLLGVLFNILPLFEFNFGEGIYNLRILGVLQRLALVYFCAAIIIKFSREKYFLIISLFLLFMSSLLTHLYSPNAPFLYEDNLNIFIDLFILSDNHILIKNPPFEPEGFFGTIPSIAQMLLGFYAMNLSEKEEYREQIFLGTSIIFLGGVWSIFDIISKPMWTAPYTLLTTGFFVYLLLLITLLVKKFRRNFFYLQALGSNPIFFYVASNFLLILFTVNSIYFDIYSINKLLPILCAFCWCVLWIPLAIYLWKNDIKIKI